MSGLACGPPGDSITVVLDEGTAAPSARQSREPEGLKIGIGAMLTPRAGFDYYRQFVEYLQSAIGEDLILVDKDSYTEVNEALASGEIDVAFVCSRPYVVGHDAFGLELLAAPQVRGEVVYYSYIIAPQSSDADSVEDLRGRVFALTDPLSNTGDLAPRYMLHERGLSLTDFFERTVHTYAHDKSIRAVAEGTVDGASVDSIIWHNMADTEPGVVALTKVIDRSPPFGIPPVVVRSDLDPRSKVALARAFMTAHESPRGREILDGMAIERFVTIQDDAYDSIREMEAWTHEQVPRSESKLDGPP